MKSDDSATIPLEAPQQTAAARAGVATLVLLSLGHCSVDLYSGALGALQPVFVDRLGLSLTQAGIVAGVFVVTSSMIQPAYGYLSDRLRTRLLAALAPGVSGIAISLLGLTPAYGWLLALVALAGSGVAAFHPQASATVAFSTATRRGGWMAIFLSSGTLGMAIGPAYISGVLGWLGLTRMYWAALPGVLVSLFLLATLPRPPAPAGAAGGKIDWELVRPLGKPLAVLYSLVVIRSVLQIAFAQFLPLYLYRERGFSLPEASYGLTLFLAAGAAGTFTGGHLADRLGGRRVILISMAACLPFLLLFFLGSGAAAMFGLAVGGFLLLFTNPVIVVMGQEMVPSQAGTVSALMMGFGWGTAGTLFVPLIGWTADLFSLHRVMLALLVFPVLGLLLALKLKR